MPKSVNKVILVGNVGKDPEVRYSQSGTPVANFSLATNERFKDRSGEWQDRTEWHTDLNLRVYHSAMPRGLIEEAAFPPAFDPSPTRRKPTSQIEMWGTPFSGGTLRSEEHT